MEGSHALQRGLEWADSSCMPRLVCITMAHGPSSNVHAPIFGSYHGPSVSFASFQIRFRGQIFLCRIPLLEENLIRLQDRFENTISKLNHY